MTRALITRPQADAERFAALLNERGLTPVIAPVMKIIHRPAPPDLAADLADVQALLFTSANGVRAFAAASPRRDKPVFTVGAATAVAAREAGFHRVESADGDGAGLARLAAQRLDPAAGPLFHAAGTVGGGDLKQALEQTGFTVRRAALYQARIVPRLPAAACRALSGPDGQAVIEAAFFFSPRTARAFVRLVTAAGLETACAGVTAYALSPAAAEPLRTLAWRGVVTAGRPETAALLDAFGRRPP